MKSKTSTASDNQEAFQRLSDILDTLRKECPWDKAQTMKSLRYLTIEEVHELSEAIVAQSPDEIKKELGDLAMHILFYCKVAEDEGLFSTTDVYNAICDKLIARHPFIYDKENYHGENWEQLKMREGRKNVLEGVPDSLPTLVKTVRMQEKVAGHTDNTLEPSELTEEEFGQKLFDLVDWGRRHGLNADDALALANRRFKEKHSQKI
ncbi:MAG: nucleoside triphosphate pyrophosphohydrolase [Bacteroidales bacterium]|nr:nucleoside triphosphate pyrophosphohydrolase [Bacteroidales bacterium]